MFLFRTVQKLLITVRHLVSQVIKECSLNEELSRTNIDLNAGTELNKYLSMDGKLSLSRTKATDRPEYGNYGAINQLMGIPNNIRLDDLKQYSDEDHVHVNWHSPSAGVRNRTMYYINAIIQMNVGVHSVITMQKSTLLTGCISLLNMRSTIIVLVLKVRMPAMVSIMKLQYQLLLMMK